MEESSIYSAVKDFVDLEPAGDYYKGKCPFTDYHEDKGKHFTISPPRNSFYCFGCKRAGGPESFIENIKKYRKNFFE